MGNLLASLINSASAMKTYDRALNVVQNNVANASTPGWVKQTQSLTAMPFDPAHGILGGVMAGDLIDSRSEYAERAVREQSEYSGYASQKAQGLAQLEPVLSIGDGSGLSASIDSFFNSVSQWSVNPNDNGSRQVVLDRAATLTRAFNTVSNGLVNSGAQVDAEMRGTITAINRLSGDLQEINRERRQNFNNSQDAGLSAKLYSTLEELSQYTDYTALPQPDGTVSVFLGGQVPMVVGDHLYGVSFDNSDPAKTVIRDSQGNDVTSTISRGNLAAELELRNTTLTKMRGQLDTLASSLADQVNGVLASGLDANGAAPTRDLFHYDPAGAAATLSVNPLDTSELAAAVAGTPGGNDNALSLVRLSTTQQVGGLTYTQYYGQMAATVGREYQAAQDDKSVRDTLLSQARSMRNDMTGVSLDEEAIKLIELQRGYQANAKLLSTLNDLTEVVMSILK